MSLQLRSLSPGDGIAISQEDDVITISATPGGNVTTPIEYTGTINNNEIIKASNSGVESYGIEGYGTLGGVSGSQPSTMTSVGTPIYGVYGTLQNGKSTNGLSCGVLGYSLESATGSSGVYGRAQYGTGITGHSDGNAGGAFSNIDTESKGFGVVGSGVVDVACKGNGLLYLTKRLGPTGLEPTTGVLIYCSGSDLYFKSGNIVKKISAAVV